MRQIRSALATGLTIPLAMASLALLGAGLALLTIGGAGAHLSEIARLNIKG